MFAFSRFTRYSRSTSYLMWHSKVSFDCLKPNFITLSWSQTGPKLVAEVQQTGIWRIAR